MAPAPRPSRFAAPIVRAGAIACVALAAALALRHLAIEPASIAHACDPQPWAGACALRSAAVRLFVNQEIGWLAFVAGAAATVQRGPRLATAALAAGAAGLVLYSYEPSAFGALLGALVLARTSAPPASTAISPA
ncbi:MAG: hypothetical protein NTW15_22980 [Burkholderiales bacterium]|nr:hypothetical protein [Burkholderiales bacterium]